MEKKTQVVMLNTDKLANLCLAPDNKLYSYNDLHEGETYKGFELFFLSDDKIKEGDYFIEDQEIPLKCLKIDQQYIVFDKNSDESILISVCKKIIASTDKSLGLPRPSNSFIQKYVEEYNKSSIITEIMVEYYKSGRTNTAGIWDVMQSNIYSPKTKLDNTIIIKPFEETWDDIEDKFFEIWEPINEFDKMKFFIKYLKENYQVPKQIK